MAWMIALDIFVILLLGAGIYYAWRLERMLRALDGNRRDMQKFVADFGSTISRAERGIRELQDTAQDTGMEVDRQMTRAGTLRDELTYLIDAADKIATRLTENSSQVLSRQPEPPPPAVQEVRKAVEEKPVEKAAPEEPVLPPWAKRASQSQVVVNPKGAVRKPEQVPQAQKAAAALEAVSEKPATRPGMALRSELERDLLKAFEKAS
jgi:hypothetical protein